VNNSPVLKLQDMAGSSSCDIQELLARAKMIAVKLDLAEVTDWLNKEINGYPDRNQLPSYRLLNNLPIKAFNPYNGWIPFKIGSIALEDPKLYNILTTLQLVNPLSMLSNYAKSTETLYSDLPYPLANLLNSASQGPDFRLSWEINPALVTKILSAIRSRILDWSLDLEKAGILGEGLLFSQQEKEAAHMTVNNNTNNFHAPVNNAGVIGSGNGDITQNNSITSGDFNSLEKQLKEWGVSDEDVRTLHQVVQESPAPTSPDNFGSRIGEWLGNTIGKAYAGTLRIAGSAAPVLLTNAICQYYGIPV